MPYSNQYDLTTPTTGGASAYSAFSYMLNDRYTEYISYGFLGRKEPPRYCLYLINCLSSVHSTEIVALRHIGSLVETNSLISWYSDKHMFAAHPTA